MQTTSPPLPHIEGFTPETGERPDWSRWLALGGIGFFVTQMAVPIVSGGLPPSPNASTQTILNTLLHHHTGILIAQFLQLVSVISFIAFIAPLWHAVNRVDPSGVLGVTIALATALALSLTAVEHGAISGMLLQTRMLHDPGLVRALFDVGNVAYCFYWLAIAVILAVPSLLSLGGRVLPRWLGRTGLLMAILALVGSLDLFADRDNALRTVFGADFPLLAAWVLASSIALYRREVSGTERSMS